MTIRAHFLSSSEDAIPTMEWLLESGIARVESWEQVCDIGVIEVQLKETPAVLAYLSQVDDTLSISRITSQGIVFYLTDLPLWAGVAGCKQRVSAERPDGFLFCPMSNVVCINTFGSVYAHQLKV